MTFLTPIALFGLIAASIPVLLHIINLRRLKTIEFSTLSFLKELQKTKIQRLKIKQLLLLILRTLLIVLIVLAFSRPTLKGSLPAGLSGQAKTTAVILFDDSPSMTASDEQGELLRQAKNSAIAVINLLKDGDELFFVKLSEVDPDNNSSMPSGQRNFSAIRREINNTKSSYIYRSIEDGVRYCARLLGNSKNFNREVYIISDFQSGSLESSLDRKISSEQLFSPATHFFLVPLGKSEPRNIALESAEIPNAIFETGKPFIIKAKVRNFGPSDVQNHLVSIYQDGNHAAQKGIDVPGGQSAEMEFSLVPRHPGFLQGIIELEDDDLIFDNKRYFIVDVPEELRVLLIGSASDFTYIRLALAARRSDSSASLKVSETTWERFFPSQLKEADVIVLANPPELTGLQYESLKTYLHSGGGALIMPGAHSTVTAFNKSISAILGFPRTASLESRSGTGQSSESFIEFDKTDLQHPLFAGMFEKENKSAGIDKNRKVLESPRIKNTLRLQAAPQSRTIISLTNGAPFLSEEKVGNGRVLIVSVPASTDWSDFPLKALFVPLIHRSLSYLAQEPAKDRSIITGEKRKIQLRDPGSARLTIKKPDGAEIIINSQMLSDAKKINFTYSDIPGIYTILSGKSVVDMFAVNIDPNESNTIPSTQKQRRKMLGLLGIKDDAIHAIEREQEANKVITETRLGAELWKQLIIIALLTAVAEMFIARSTKRSLTGITSN